MAGRLPTIPDFLLKPFADAGNKIKIPEVQQSPGRASLDIGFPTETQLPLSDGGVAPNRLDFQGILNQLAQFAFYYQSGGVMPYSQQVNYVRPALVFHDSEYWFCERSNGPNAPNGMVAPGTNDDVWSQFNPKKASGAVPIGTVITYWGATSPEGYLPCNGEAFSASQYPELYRVLGKALTPDLRGYFIRGKDTRYTVDPDGAARSIGSIQGDAIRNIYGNFGSGIKARKEGVTGAFTTTGISGHDYKNGNSHGVNFDFDASRMVPTATENRPKNVCLLYCIKHD